MVAQLDLLVSERLGETEEGLRRAIDTRVAEAMSDVERVLGARIEELAAVSNAELQESARAAAAEQVQRREEVLRAELNRRFAEHRLESARSIEDQIAARVGAAPSHPKAGPARGAESPGGDATATAQVEGRAGAGGDLELEATMTRLAAAMERVEGALSEIGKSERRILDVYGQLSAVEARVVEATRTAKAATDVEARLRSAAEVEDEAARRIREAELRLRDDLER